MPTVYPSSRDLARSFYAESVRHLEDAVVLLDNDRFAVSVSSAMKAAELAVKSAAIIDNATGFWDELFKSHKPLTKNRDSSTPERVHRSTRGENPRAGGSREESRNA